jgi:HK97 family phage prohead protease
MDRLEIKAQFAVDEAGIVEGIAWPFDGGPDMIGDLIAKGAFAGAMPPLPMLFSHDQRDTVGVWDSITETERGLEVRGRLLVDDVARAREVRALVREKAVTGLSIGYRSQRAITRKGGGRTLLALDLKEISIVAVGMHPGARITSAKAAAAEPGEGMMPEEQTAAPEIAALEAKTAEIAETVKGLGKLGDRLDRIEAKVNRPAGGAAPDEDAAAERKAFVAYLQKGINAPADELKSLSVSSDPQGGYLAPAEMAGEFIRDLLAIGGGRVLLEKLLNM